jgi:uroporphyrin-III C-methyltransferase
MKGKVYIVGGGPGDPDLITLRGLEIIKKADVIVYDRLVPRKLLDYAPEKCEFIYVGKKRGHHTYTQDEINRLLVEKAREGRIVVRLKGGDPYIFGRGEEECIFLLEHDIDCEVIPGISSILAAPIYSGIPLTNRWYSSSFAVLTGEEAKEKEEKRVDIKRIASAVDTLIIVMGSRRFPDIVNELKKVLDDATPIAVVVNASMEDQYTLISTLGEADKIAEDVKPPSIIIVGKVVSLRDKLWHKD